MSKVTTWPTFTVAFGSAGVRITGAVTLPPIADSVVVAPPEVEVVVDDDESSDDEQPTSRTTPSESTAPARIRGRRSDMGLLSGGDGTGSSVGHRHPT